MVVVEERGGGGGGRRRRRSNNKKNMMLKMKNKNKKKMIMMMMTKSNNSQQKLTCIKTWQRWRTCFSPQQAQSNTTPTTHTSIKNGIREFLLLANVSPNASQVSPRCQKPEESD
ncbi:putative ribonuclease Oy [Trichinella spiralis]|uniref:putative ribonuclease Oy n=1 Tax=Trichinella spiralis TaxID=6334 RepID=UPI0001EFD0FA|nr:putative ribonuclease Oy [Trichinella spiralis]